MDAKRGSPTYVYLPAVRISFSRGLSQETCVCARRDDIGKTLVNEVFARIAVMEIVIRRNAYVQAGARAEACERSKYMCARDLASLIAAWP